jgi:HPt (histidine-containing phosphotransfer) domain-containing protein
LKEQIRSTYESNADIQPFIKLYIEVLEDRLMEIKKALEVGDQDAVCAVSHKFYGTSASFGFPDICKLMLEVEGAFCKYKADNESLATVQARFNQLAMECAKIQTRDLEKNVSISSVLFK